MQQPTRVCAHVQAANGCQLAHLHTNMHKHIGALWNLHCVVVEVVCIRTCVCVRMCICVCLCA